MTIVSSLLWETIAYFAPEGELLTLSYADRNERPFDVVCKLSPVRREARFVFIRQT